MDMFKKKKPFWHFIGHFDVHVFQLTYENDETNENKLQIVRYKDKR